MNLSDFLRNPNIKKAPKNKKGYHANESNRRSVANNSNRDVHDANAIPDPPAAVGTRRQRASGGSATAGARSTRKDDPSASGGSAAACVRDIGGRGGSLSKAFSASGGPATACWGCPGGRDETNTDGDVSRNDDHTDCEEEKDDFYDGGDMRNSGESSIISKK